MVALRVYAAGLTIVLGVLFGAAKFGFAEIYAPGTPLPADYVLGPTSPGKWGDPTLGTAASVTYSFMPSGVKIDETIAGGSLSTSVALSSFMPTGWEAEIRRAFDAWTAVSGITFVEVVDSATAFNAAGAFGDIRIAGHVMDNVNGVLAHAFHPPNNGTSAAGDLHFDSDENWKIGFGGPGFDIFQVAAHEIGHAIGLDHTSVPNSLMNPNYTEAFSGPQADEAEGARALYGAPLAVPEPSSLALSSLLALAFVGHRIRRHRVAA